MIWLQNFVGENCNRNFIVGSNFRIVKQFYELNKLVEMYRKKQNSAHHQPSGKVRILKINFYFFIFSVKKRDDQRKGDLKSP